MPIYRTDGRKGFMMMFTPGEILGVGLTSGVVAVAVPTVEPKSLGDPERFGSGSLYSNCSV